MKKILFAALLLGSGHLMAQSCCAISATQKFANMSNDPEFVRAHEEPLPFDYAPENGSDINIKAIDSTDVHLYEIKSKTASNKYIFVIQEWWGLNDYIKKASEDLYKELAAENVNVIALDLYDNKVATTREDAGKYMGEAKKERIEMIINSTLKYCGKEAKIYTIGWCFGGGWSLQASLLAGKQAAGCVMYYGMPEKDVARLKTLNCDVLGLFASKEKWISPEIVNQFEKDLKTAGKKAIIKRYDAEHAFANPSNPNFDKVATEDAHAAVLAFFKARMNFSVKMKHGGKGKKC